MSKRKTAFLAMPARMKELWPWVCALTAFEYGDPEELSKLILAAQEVPPERGRPQEFPGDVGTLFFIPVSTDNWN